MLTIRCVKQLASASGCRRSTNAESTSSQKCQANSKCKWSKAERRCRQWFESDVLRAVRKRLWAQCRCRQCFQSEVSSEARKGLRERADTDLTPWLELDGSNAGRDAPNCANRESRFRFAGPLNPATCNNSLML